MSKQETVVIAPAATQRRLRVDRWFYISVALLMIVFNVVAFTQSIIDPSRRNAPLPLTPLVTAHAIVSVAWLVLFLTQATLVATRHIPDHRRVGMVITVMFIVLGFFTTIEQARRGFDFGGDIDRVPAPPGVSHAANTVVLLFLFLNFAIIVRRGIVVSASLQHPQTPDVTCDARGVDAHPCCTSHRSLDGSPAVGERDLSGELCPVCVVERNLRPGVGGSRSFGVGLVPTLMLAWQLVLQFVVLPSAMWGQFAAWLIR